MEISEIVIKDFKGIEEVKISPVKPINVLIGRNNSGKSSILQCMHLMHKYFDSIQKRPWENSQKTLTVPAEYFRRGGGQLEVSVTISQDKDERRRQFTNAVEGWNKQYSRRLAPESISVQLESDLLATLTFEFATETPKEHFGVIRVVMRCTDENRKQVDTSIAETKDPNGALQTLPLESLFAQIKPISLLELQKKGLQEDPKIEVQWGRLEAIGQRPAIFWQYLVFPTFDYIKKAFQSAFMVSPYRHGNAVMLPQRCGSLSENGTNLVNYLHDLNLNNYQAFEKIAGFVRGIVPEVGRLHPRFVKEGGSELELAYDWDDGHIVNLTNMGGGVEQLLILACLLIQQKTACILWEEPESHLHPGAQEILLNELEENVGDSTIFITTHSPVFVRSSDKIAVHVITNTDGKSAKGRTLTRDDLQQAAIAVGLRPGHLAQADIVIYVEGLHGAEVMEEWLEKWPKKNEVLEHLLLVVQPCNADEIGSPDYDLTGLTRVTPNMIMFVDKDNDKGSDEPKKARKNLIDKCNKSGIPCIVTNKRQVEDYFTEETVRKGLPENLLASWTYDPNKSMGEQLDSGWKKHNRRIAEKMEWKDVEKHKDIMQIFEKIEELAKSLKAV